MFLKRISNDDGQFTTVQVRNLSPEWHLTPKLLHKGITDGWLTLARGAVTLHATTGDIKFTIVHGPGAYRADTDEALDTRGSGAERRYLEAGSLNPVEPEVVDVRNFFKLHVQQETVPKGMPSVQGGSVEAATVRADQLKAQARAKAAQ